MFYIPLRATHLKVKTYKSLQIKRFQVFLFFSIYKSYNNSQEKSESFSESFSPVYLLTNNDLIN